MSERAQKERNRAPHLASQSRQSFSDRRLSNAAGRPFMHAALNQSLSVRAIAQLSTALNSRPRSGIVQRVIAEGVDMAAVDRRLSHIPKFPRAAKIRAATNAPQILSSVEEVVAFCLQEPETLRQQQERIARTTRIAMIPINEHEYPVHEGHLEGGAFQAVVDAHHLPGTTWELANVGTGGRNSSKLSFHVHPAGFGNRWEAGAEMIGGHQNNGRQTPQDIVQWITEKFPLNNYL